MKVLHKEKGPPTRGVPFWKKPLALDHGQIKDHRSRDSRVERGSRKRVNKSALPLVYVFRHDVDGYTHAVNHLFLVLSRHKPNDGG